MSSYANEDWFKLLLGLTWLAVIVLAAFVCISSVTAALDHHEYDCSKHGGLVVHDVTIKNTDGFSAQRICQDGYQP